ncbi:MAG TPA: hypothetical protein VL092_04190 [Chitinophagaceae bacterium]|nr:hypothetical protein [Chitinophagaceae bacterium]
MAELYAPALGHLCMLSFYHPTICCAGSTVPFPAKTNFESDNLCGSFRSVVSHTDEIADRNGKTEKVWVHCATEIFNRGRQAFVPKNTECNIVFQESTFYIHGTAENRPEEQHYKENDILAPYTLSTYAAGRHQLLAETASVLPVAPSAKKVISVQYTVSGTGKRGLFLPAVDPILLIYTPFFTKSNPLLCH